MSSDAVGPSSTGIGRAERITSAASTATVTGRAATAGGTQTLRFRLGGAAGAPVEVTAPTTDSAVGNAASLVQAIDQDANLRGAGVFAFDVPGGAVRIASLGDFSLEVGSTGTEVGDGFAPGSVPVTPATASGGAVGANQALDAIRLAITRLGEVRGRVGEAVNRALFEGVAVTGILPSP